MSSGFEPLEMRRILHILNRPADPVVTRLIEDQRRSADHEVVVHPLEGDAPEYRLLLEEVFKADSIECW